MGATCGCVRGYDPKNRAFSRRCRIGSNRGSVSGVPGFGARQADRSVRILYHQQPVESDQFANKLTGL